MVVIMRDVDHKSACGGEQGHVFQVEVSLKLQEGLLKKGFIFDIDDKIWYAKVQVINDLAKGVKDAFNYGFYEPPYNGKSGKFMDEERTFRDYPQRGSPAVLEFKYKRRVYKSMQYDGKTLQKVHTKSNLKKLLEYVSSNSVAQVTKWTEKGLDPNFQDDKSGETPLTTAVISDDRQDLIVALVNGGAHLDYRAGDALTPMHKAAVAGKSRSVKILLDLGCPPNIKGPKGLTPLYYTVLHGGDANCCELLLNEHAEIGVSDHQGMQEIHHACKKGLVQHLEHLLFYGANIDATTASGNTALHITALSNHEECARVLLFRGARRDILNYANQSAYEVAAVAGNKELAEFIRRFSDGQIITHTEKPTYSTRRRKTVAKPRASSLFPSTVDTNSIKSDSSLPPSPRSSGSHTRSSSNADTISLEENGPYNGRKQRSVSVCSTNSESSYCSDPESVDLTVNERRSRAQKNRSRDVQSGKMAPPVKMVSGAATVRKRLYANNAPGRRYIAVKDYAPCMGGELQVERGDIVEVLYVGERGFWEGRIENRTGWFPSVCVEELKKEDKVRPKTLFGRPPSLAAMFAKNDMHDPRAPLPPDHRFIQPPRVVVLNRGRAGFGFQMRGANCQTPRLNFRPSKEFPALQYIGEVEPGGEADFKGVKNDDFIIEVNDEEVTTATHSHVVNLIKRSGNCVKLKIVTVPPNIVNGFDTLDGGRRGKVPPPLPQRDPSTTLTLGRMRTSSRPSLFDAGLVYSQEEPASLQVDSVIAVSKDSPWHTLQRRKPGASNSRSAAQFKFNTTSRNKTRNTNGGLSADQRSRSMQNIASLSSTDTVSAKRPVSTAVPFAIPQVPVRSMSHDAESLSRTVGDIRSHSDPNLDKPIPMRSLSVDESQYDMRNSMGQSPTQSMSVDQSRYGIGQLPTRSISVDQSRYGIGQPPTRSISVDQSRPMSVDQSRSMSVDQSQYGIGQPPTRSMSVDQSRPMSVDQSRYDMHYNVKSTTTDFGARNEEETIVATPISTTVSYVEERVTSVYDTNNNGRQNANEEIDGERKHSLGSNEPFSLSSALQKAVEARNIRINEQNTNSRKVSAPASIISQRRRGNTATDRLRSDIMSQLNNTQLNTDNEHVDGSYHTRDNYNAPRPSLDRQSSSNLSTSPSKHKGSPKKTNKPTPAPKPTAPPPPPPVPPIAPPAPVVPPVAPAAKPNKTTKGKKRDIPQTAVQQGLITVDALQAKRGKLKAVPNNEAESPKSSKSIHSMVGKLAGHGGRAGGKPAPTFSGNQHAHLLAKAVAARAARLATEARENEHSDSPSSWEDETTSPTIPCSTSSSPSKPTQTSPKKTPPPVLPKKKSPLPGHRQFSPRTETRPESDSPNRRMLFPPRVGDYNHDRSYDSTNYSTEEDRTMMLFDDVIRKEVECENWSLNSWNSSDSSSLAEGMLPPGSYLGNGHDERQRKSSLGSGSRPWYEYSSGSPSEESLSASSERISLLKSSLSLDEGTRVNGDRTAESLRRRYSDEDGNPLNSTLTREEISLVPVDEKRSNSFSNLSKNSNEIVNDSYQVDKRSVTDDVSRKYTPTNSDIGRGGSGLLTDRLDGGVTRRSISPSSETSQDSDVVEKVITTPSGVKITLLLQANNSPTKNDQDHPSNNQHSTSHESISQNIPPMDLPTKNHITDDINEFLPPPPMDFHVNDVDNFEMSSPPLPPPPDFLPVEGGVFDSPLPAPPIDFSDDFDVDQGSSLDVPAAQHKQNSGGSSFQEKALLEWNCNDVCDWLDHLHLSQYKETFRENDIQGLHLPELTKIDLLELGIKSLGHRITMENSVAKLCHPLESNC